MATTLSGALKCFGAALALSLAVALRCVAAGADGDDPRDLLARMVAASEGLDYTGVFLYQRGNDIDVMRIVHKQVDGAAVERLVSLTGPAREVIRDGSQVTCTFADDEAVVVGPRQRGNFLPLDLTRPLSTIEAYYRFEHGEPERIAGRSAVTVHIVPLNADRYGYRLALDSEFGLLLKSVVLDMQARPLEQFQFTDIEIAGSIDDNELKPEIKGDGFTWYSSGDSDTAGAGAAGPELTVRWLPAGFEEQKRRFEKMSSSRTPVRHTVYSDGLAMVSVFVERLSDGETPIEGHSSFGAVNAFSRSDDSHQITVVGEVPRLTVSRIARSIVATPQTQIQ